MTSQDFTRREITSVYADFLVELRGFEPMVIADARRPSSYFSPANARSLLVARAVSIAMDPWPPSCSLLAHSPAPQRPLAISLIEVDAAGDAANARIIFLTAVPARSAVRQTSDRARRNLAPNLSVRR